MIYVPLVGPTPGAGRSDHRRMSVKSARAATIAADIRALLREYAPEAPMYRIFTMESLAARSLAQLSFTMLMLAIASGLR